jgi:hypothetical protein
MQSHQTRERKVESVPKRGANAAAQKHNKVAYRSIPHISGKRKTALRRTDSYRHVAR